MNKYYPRLFEPIKINGLRLKNRIAYAPMGCGLGQASGEASAREIAYLEARAAGGCGLIHTGYAAVAGPELSGLAHINQLHVQTLSHRSSLQVLAEHIHRHDAAIFIQLHHPGYMAPPFLNNGNRAMSADEGIMGCRAMTKEDISKVTEAFANAAEHCFIAGIDGVEIHCAHGYLLNQFMSPHTNHRTDEYGGSVENRLRFTVEVIKAVRAKVPRSYPVTIRINAADNAPGGIDIPLAQEYAKYIDSLGLADAFDVSCGGLGGMEAPHVKSGWKRFMAKAIKEVVKVPVIGVNTIKDPELAEELIEENVSDIVSVGRAQIADPEWANKSMEGRADEILPCLSCNTCHQVFYEHIGLRCAVNPQAGRECDPLPLVRDGAGRKIIVAGAGPGGIQAALTLAERGFAVTLIDKNERIGGALLLAEKAPGKDKITKLLVHYAEMLKKAGVEVMLNTEADADLVRSLSPYAVVVAAGGRPIIPAGISQSNHSNTVLAHDVLKGAIKPKHGASAVIIGSGMTGIETAEVLHQQGCRVSIYDMLRQPCRGCDGTIVMDVLQRFKDMNIPINGGHRLIEIAGDRVVFENETGRMSVNADMIVLSLGIESDTSLFEELSSLERVYQIGDCRRPGRIIEAVWDGYRIGSMIYN